MANNVGELVIQLSANVARLQQDMQKSTRTQRSGAFEKAAP